MGLSIDEIMKRPVDLEHYRKHKDRLDADIKAAVEAGTAQAFGIPPGFPSETVIKRAVIMCDKYPELGKAAPEKPLTGSQKRKQRRFDRNAEPDEVVEYEMVEAGEKISGDRQFKIVSGDEWKPHPNPQYKKDGKLMPKDFVPFKQLPDGPLPSVPNGGKAIEASGPAVADVR